MSALFVFSACVNAGDHVAEVEPLATALHFYAAVPHEHLELTIAGDNVRREAWFGRGEIPYFSMLDEPLPDGNYRYELLASSPVDRASWEAARDDWEMLQALERLERAATFRQAGRFEVVDGEIMLFSSSTEDERMAEPVGLPEGGR